MGLGDYLILGVLAVLVVLAVRRTLKHRGGCSGGCAGCPHAGDCDSSKRE